MDALIDSLKNREYFFDNGIRFACKNCGSCCTGESGIIYVDEHEITTIAEFIGLHREIFVQRCLYPFQDSYSIRETEDGRCLFYENGCAIYPVRPIQCRTFPFWFHNMRSEESWADVCLKCPGIGSGHKYEKDVILDYIGASYHIYEIILREIRGE